MLLNSDEILRSFSYAPEDARVKINTVQLLWGGISPSTVWRLVKSNKIPAPSKMGGRTTTWRVGDLRKALSSKGGNE